MASWMEKPQGLKGGRNQKQKKYIQPSVDRGDMPLCTKQNNKGSCEHPKAVGIGAKIGKIP